MLEDATEPSRSLPAALRVAAFLQVLLAQYWALAGFLRAMSTSPHAARDNGIWPPVNGLPAARPFLAFAAVLFVLAIGVTFGNTGSRIASVLLNVLGAVAAVTATGVPVFAAALSAHALAAALLLVPSNSRHPRTPSRAA